MIPSLPMMYRPAVVGAAPPAAAAAAAAGDSGTTGASKSQLQKKTSECRGAAAFAGKSTRWGVLR